MCFFIYSENFIKTSYDKICVEVRCCYMKKIAIMFIAAALLLMPACSAEPAEHQNTNTEISESVQNEAKKVIIAVAMNNYQKKELWPVYNTLKEEGFKITVAGSQTGRAKSGADSVEIDAVFSNVSAEDYNGIVVIGGSGVKVLWDNEELQTLIKEIYNSGGVAAAICLAPLTLAQAGVLESGSSACWYSDNDINSRMSELGITDSAQDVTISGRVITGNGPNAAQEFADEVAAALKATG